MNVISEQIISKMDIKGCYVPYNRKQAMYTFMSINTTTTTTTVFKVC